MNTILITGGVRGIGLAIAQFFKQKGYRTCVTYSRDEDSAALAKAQGLEVYRADVKDEAAITALFATIGDVDVLVNNAGVALFKQIQDVSVEEYEEVFSVNMRGAFLCCKEAAKQMLKNSRGLIVNISSVWGEVGASCESVYAASKAALLGFSKSLAKELGYSGIRVNSISPGVIDTQMNARFNEEEKRAFVEEIPLSRMGTGEEIAKAVWFLCENEYVTGVDIPVNGGFSIV